ncbi:MAG: biopolymer transporter ExbD [Planctomycetota bacterium]
MFKVPKPASMTLNLAPMVDVMMCLIIFFLLASKLVDAEHYPVDLPWAVAAQEVESQALGVRFTVNVRRAADDSDDMAEYVVVDWDGQDIIEVLLPPDQIEQRLRKRAAWAASQNQDFRCVIRADQDVQYQHVETVLRACGLAQVSKIVFSANKGIQPDTAGDT